MRRTTAFTLSSFDALVNSSLNVASRLGCGSNPSFSCELMTPDRSMSRTLLSPDPANCTSCTGPGGSRRFTVMHPGKSSIGISTASTSIRCILAIRFLHQLYEFGKQIGRIVWSRRGFGMILYRKHRLIHTGQALDRPVVQTNMGHGHFAVCRLNDGGTLGNRLALAGPGNLYGKVVILRRDFDLPRPEIHHGVIGAMMAELQLVGLQSKRESKNLMAKADAEYRST